MQEATNRINLVGFSNKQLPTYELIEHSDLEYIDFFNLVIYHEDILREVAKPVTEFGETLLKLGCLMVNTMYINDGIGLAANQVNFDQRVIVVDVSPERNNPLLLINPEILSASGETGVEEGCLSAPDMRGYVPRFEQITVKYYDWQGNEHTLEADGILSICLQHEIDHLDGKMFFDKLPPLKRNMILDKLRKNKKHRKDIGAPFTLNDLATENDKILSCLSELNLKQDEGDEGDEE